MVIILLENVIKNKMTNQLSRGQEIRWELDLHIRRQLHLHLTYFLPAGAGRIAYSNTNKKAVLSQRCTPYKGIE